MSIGAGQADKLGHIGKEGSFELLDAYYDAGGNYIDTANGYQREDSETWVGEWMQKRGEWAAHCGLVGTWGALVYHSGDQMELGRRSGSGIGYTVLCG